MGFTSKDGSRVRTPTGEPVSLLVRNLNFKTDVDYVFKINQRVLIYTASWQFRSPVLNFLRKVGNFVHFIIIGLVNLAYFIDIKRNPEIVGSDLIVEGCMFVASLGYYVKYIIMAWYMTGIRVCYEDMKADWKYVLQDGYKVMKESAQFTHKLSTYYVYFVAATFLSWHFSALARSSYVVDGVRYHNLAYPADFLFFDSRVWPVFPFIYFLQFYAISVSMAGICHNCTGAAFVTHVTGQCNILISILVQVSEKENFPDFDLKLLYVVKKHNELLRFIHRFDSIFTWVYLTEFIGCICTLCLASYLAVAKPFTLFNVMTIITIFFNGTNTFLVLCFVGERYSTAMSKFGNLFGMTNWYFLQKKHLSAFAFIQLHGMKDQSVTAGKYIDLTMETFSDVMKRTLAFFNVLKTTL